MKEKKVENKIKSRKNVNKLRREVKSRKYLQIEKEKWQNNVIEKKKKKKKKQGRKNNIKEKRNV